MYTIDISTSNHEWEKKNLVTLKKNGRLFDEMVCKNCGIKGKKYRLDAIEVSGTYAQEKVFSCPKVKNIHNVPQKVKIVRCTAHGKQFANLLPNTIHDVVIPPKGYVNDHTGVWVMGVDEPVRLFTREIEKVS